MFVALPGDEQQGVVDKAKHYRNLKLTEACGRHSVSELQFGFSINPTNKEVVYSEALSYYTEEDIKTICREILEERCL